jgi:hypothetical protein
LLPSGQKFTLGLLATITLEVVPFCPYAPFPVLLPLFKCIMFCEGIQHRLQFYLSHLSFVKIAAFQFYVQSRKQRKVGLVGDDSHVVFGQKFHGERKKFEMVCSHDATASSFVAKVQGEVIAHFHSMGIKHHSSMQN